MGLVLLIAGLLMVITGARGTYAQFGSLVAGEFQGPNNFVYWALALGGLGLVGYIPKLQTVSRLLMTLVLLTLILSHKGFFAQFQAALKAGPKQPNALPSQPALPQGSPQSMLGAQGQSPGIPGQTGTYGQAKANQYFNALSSIVSGLFGGSP